MQNSKNAINPTTQSTLDQTPMITVIMPIRNEAKFIARSLGAVLEQNYPQGCIEVLVSDGMSTDNTREIVQQTAALHPGITVRIVDNPGQIVPTGFNAALRESQGEVIVRVDGHTIIEPDYIQQCVNALRKSGADNVGGRMNAISNSEFGKVVALATSSPFGVGGARFHYSEEEEFVDTVYMGAWKRDVFDRIGFFDEELVRNQDDEFNYRLRSQGGKILLSPKIKSLYYNRGTFKTLARQYYQYGFWKVRVMQKHPAQMRPRQFAPPVLVAMLSWLGVLSFFFVSARRLLLLVAGAYSLANLAASVLTARKTSRPLSWRLPAVFATLHLSYGAGFLVGLVKFWNRWNSR